MKLALALLAGLFLVAPRVHAEDSKAKVYLENLQTKLDHIARRANQPTNQGSSVAGLRGSKQEPMSKQLYWKGKTREHAVTIDEVKLFRSAVEEARAGQVDSAKKTLQTFLEMYPKSSLKPDVEETLQVLAAKPE